MSLGRTPTRKDVQMAKKAVWWDDGADDSLAREFPVDNDPSRFSGDRSDLSLIRQSMKRYEEKEASMMEDKQYYDARFRLQFVDVDDA